MHRYSKQEGKYTGIPDSMLAYTHAPGSMAEYADVLKYTGIQDSMVVYTDAPGSMVEYNGVLDSVVNNDIPYYMAFKPHTNTLLHPRDLLQKWYM